MAERISVKKQKDMEELYHRYGMAKTARIEQLGQTIKRVNEALEEADWSTVPPDRLLKLKIEYLDRLRKEFSVLTAKEIKLHEGKEADDLLAVVVELINRIRNGDITDEQAAIEQKGISNLIAAYEGIKVQSKLDEIEEILGDTAAKDSEEK